MALHNITLLETLEVAFQPGFNVITGETGSGKSLMMDALQRVFEKRLSPKELLRQGSDRGRIELTFDLNQVPQRQAVVTLLEDLGIDLMPEEHELLVSREMTPTGSRCRVNGCVIPVDGMEKLGTLLLEIYGQHDLHQLFSTARQRDLVDNVGGEALLTVRRTMRETYRQWQQLNTQLVDLQAQQVERTRKLDFLAFQLAEIAQAELDNPKEDIALQQERERLAHSEQLCQAATEAAFLLQGASAEEGVTILSRIQQIQKAIRKVSAWDPVFQQWDEQLLNVEEALRDLGRQMDSYADAVETQPARMQEIVERLDLLEKLKRKYGGTLAAVMETGEALSQEYTTLSQSEQQLSDLTMQVAEKADHHAALCRTLTELRSRTAAVFAETIQQELQSLLLPAARFQVDIRPTDPGETGQDQVTFLFSANPGEPLKPLAQVASGGELSRLMLALKTRTMHSDRLATLVLDEIDIGMSGVTLRAVAEKLQSLQQHCQVIVITHQPIVAAKATWHLHVEKALLPDGVNITIRALTQPEARKAVLAQLASGLTEDDLITTQFVEQLLA